MPDPPEVGLVTRYALENPWPLGGLLLAVAAVLAWTGLRDGATARLRAALGTAFAAATVIATGLLVTTAGERAEAVTRAFVAAVEAGDLVGAADAIAHDGTLSVGAVTNPGRDKDFIIDRLDRLARQYTISDNRVTTLRAYTTAADAATVHLGCATEVEGGWGPTATGWVVVVRRQPDDTWAIQRLAWISLQGKSVDGRYLGG